MVITRSFDQFLIYEIQRVVDARASASLAFVRVFRLPKK